MYGREAAMRAVERHSLAFLVVRGSLFYIFKRRIDGDNTRQVSYDPSLLSGAMVRTNACVVLEGSRAV